MTDRYEGQGPERPLDDGVEFDYRTTEEIAMEFKCPKCGVSAFQHWNFGHMHKCHVCGTVWKSDSN